MPVFESIYEANLSEADEKIAVAYEDLVNAKDKFIENENDLRHSSICTYVFWRAFEKKVSEISNKDTFESVKKEKITKHIKDAENLWEKAVILNENRDELFDNLQKNYLSLKQELSSFEQNNPDKKLEILTFFGEVYASPDEIIDLLEQDLEIDKDDYIQRKREFTKIAVVKNKSLRYANETLKTEESSETKQEQSSL